MKKSALISLIVFLAVFLMWPTTKPTGCDLTEQEISLGATRVPDCQPRETVEGIGGGVRYLQEGFRTGVFRQPYSAIYRVGGKYNDSYFHLNHALGASVVTSILTMCGLLLMSRRTKSA